MESDHDLIMERIQNKIVYGTLARIRNYNLKYPDNKIDESLYHEYAGKRGYSPTTRNQYMKHYNA